MSNGDRSKEERDYNDGFPYVQIIAYTNISVPLLSPFFLSFSIDLSIVHYHDHLMVSSPYYTPFFLHFSYSRHHDKLLCRKSILWTTRGSYIT